MTALVECVTLTPAGCNHGPRNDEKAVWSRKHTSAPWLAGEPRRTTGTGGTMTNAKSPDPAGVAPDPNRPCRAARMTSPWQTENEQAQKCRRGRKRQREGGEPDRAAPSWKSSRGAAARWTGGRPTAGRHTTRAARGSGKEKDDSRIKSKSNPQHSGKDGSRSKSNQSNPQNSLEKKRGMKWK